MRISPNLDTLAHPKDALNGADLEGLYCDNIYGTSRLLFPMGFRVRSLSLEAAFRFCTVRSDSWTSCLGDALLKTDLRRTDETQ